MTQRTWTASEELILRTGVADRALASDIGEALGRTKNSIIGKAHKLGMSWGLSAQEVSARATANAKLGMQKKIPETWEPEGSSVGGCYISGFDNWSMSDFIPSKGRRF